MRAARRLVLIRRACARSNVARSEGLTDGGSRVQERRVLSARGVELCVRSRLLVEAIGPSGSAGLRERRCAVSSRLLDGHVASAHQCVHSRSRQSDGQAVTGGIRRLWCARAPRCRRTYTGVGIEVRVSRVVVDL
eukprot:6212735-Pleurochrysis_carterae.AAC.7